MGTNTNRCWNPEDHRIFTPTETILTANLDHPANQGILRHLKRNWDGSRPEHSSRAPTEQDLYGLGTHPDLVDHLWKKEEDHGQAAPGLRLGGLCPANTCSPGVRNYFRVRWRHP